jgi:Retroviral aspartyl protease
MQKLGLKIDKSSKTQLTLADGIKRASMGKALIEIEIDEYIIPVQVEIIESKSVDLLLGTELLSQIQGKVDFKKNKLTFQAEDNKVEIPIYYTRKQILKDVRDNNEEDSEEEFEETDYEKDYESDGTEEELHTIIEEKTEEVKQPVLAQTVERP